MFQERHPAVAELIIGSLQEGPPEWTALAGGLRPEPREPELHEPGGQSGLAARSSQPGRAPLSGCMHLATPHSYAPRHVEVTERPSCWHHVPSGTVVLLDQVGTGLLQGSPPAAPLIASAPGRLLDAFGHHRAACSWSGVLGREGSLWRVQLLGCAEKQGERVATNLLVRDMDLAAPNAHDCRVAVGLPLFGGVQLAVDTTLVSPVRGGGQPQRGASDRDGVALKRARRKKETTYPELVRLVSRARLVVLGGRWSQEAWIFVQLLAQARARSEIPLTRRRMEQAWRLRWYSVISCAAARAFAASLLELRGGHGACGQPRRVVWFKRNFVARVRDVSVPSFSCKKIGQAIHVGRGESLSAFPVRLVHSCGYRLCETRLASCHRSRSGNDCPLCRWDRGP